MSSIPFQERAKALQAQAAQLGADIASAGASLEPAELFELSGDLQGVSNAVEGAQLVAIAHASSRETRLTERGPVDVQHDVGFVDAMASSEVSLATGVGQWAAGRKVGLAAALASRFPRLLGKVVAGELAPVNAQKVVTVCDGLDDTVCAAVEAVLVDRLVGMDPGQITTLARRVATRIAAEQVAAAAARNKKDRCVQVSPGPDGTTDWWARVPTERAAQAWSAITILADTYAEKDESLTLDQARADAFMDLLLTNVTVTAKVTLGIPVITGPEGEAARDAAIAARSAEGGSDSAAAPATDAVADVGSGTPGDVADDAVGCRPAVATGGRGLGATFSLSAALMSGCEVPGVGFVDADTVEALLSAVPTDIGRALLDARTGTLVESVTSAYRPPRAVADFVATRDGTCRMWGCTRLATRCDIDHARPWPNGPTSPSNLGGLCRRHHRLKQRRRWAYQLARDGTATWTSPTGTKRVTQPDHAALPPPPTPVPAQPTTSREPELVDIGPPPF